MLRRFTVTTAAVAVLAGVAVAPAMAAPTPTLTAAPSTAAEIPNEVDVASANFDQVMEWSKTKPVVLDFTASWCGACQAQKPYLEKYNKEDNGKWVWARVDVDTNQELSDRYHIEYIPTLIDIKKGEEAGSRQVGFDAPESLRAWLNKL
ncbi:thioredoxin family protein [Streptomyces halobius]|uniref:Thioredoxin family protein n=1 Tax=Streptomyces halobius TaxID=2879846 RepID=A0ABY4M4C9_9ACTN|nr:thioredoxin family protein [Streptomyces halobius]UQA92118.1 thioredoxin family protein [Streptomyces halobius]